MTNVERIDCDELFGSLHEVKLRNIDFKFEGNSETLNEYEIELILQLIDCIDHCWENCINIYDPVPMLHDAKEDFDNFRKATFLSKYDLTPCSSNVISSSSKSNPLPTMPNGETAKPNSIHMIHGQMTSKPSNLDDNVTDHSPSLEFYFDVK